MTDLQIERRTIQYYEGEQGHIEDAELSRPVLSLMEAIEQAMNSIHFVHAALRTSKKEQVTQFLMDKHTIRQEWEEIIAVLQQILARASVVKLSAVRISRHLDRVRGTYDSSITMLGRSLHTINSKSDYYRDNGSPTSDDGSVMLALRHSLNAIQDMSSFWGTHYRTLDRGSLSTDAFEHTFTPSFLDREFSRWELYQSVLLQAISSITASCDAMMVHPTSVTPSPLVQLIQRVKRNDQTLQRPTPSYHDSHSQADLDERLPSPSWPLLQLTSDSAEEAEYRVQARISGLTNAARLIHGCIFSFVNNRRNGLIKRRALKRVGVQMRRYIQSCALACQFADDLCSQTPTESATQLVKEYEVIHKSLSAISQSAGPGRTPEKAKNVIRLSQDEKIDQAEISRQIDGLSNRGLLVYTVHCLVNLKTHLDELRRSPKSLRALKRDDPRVQAYKDQMKATKSQFTACKGKLPLDPDTKRERKQAEKELRKTTAREKRKLEKKGNKNSSIPDV
ncbi:hypothetical protein ONZ45_g5176 [Pleurotus djamor]|nr:hypothetical protein ONZ45_g5176 [Pleurotus djamor]